MSRRCAAAARRAGGCTLPDDPIDQARYHQPFPGPERAPGRFRGFRCIGARRHLEKPCLAHGTALEKRGSHDAGSKAGHGYASSRHLCRQSGGEGAHVGLRGIIRRHVRPRRITGDGADIEYAAAAPPDHVREKPERQLRQRADIDIDQLELRRAIRLGDGAEYADAGAVHQHVAVNTDFGELVFDPLPGVAVGKVDAKRRELARRSGAARPRDRRGRPAQDRSAP